MNAVKMTLFACSFSFALDLLFCSGCVRKTNISPLFDSASLKGVNIEGGCGDTTLIVKRVKNANGIVRYNSYDNLYQVVTHIPGTIDSQDIGFVCNLPTSLKKEGASIQFDGDYIKLDKSITTPRAGGQSFYFLRLTRILSQTTKTP